MMTLMEYLILMETLMYKVRAEISKENFRRKNGKSYRTKDVEEKINLREAIREKSRYNPFPKNKNLRVKFFQYSI